MQLKQEQTERTEVGVDVAWFFDRLSTPHYWVTPRLRREAAFALVYLRFLCFLLWPIAWLRLRP